MTNNNSSLVSSFLCVSFDESTVFWKYTYSYLHIEIFLEKMARMGIKKEKSITEIPVILPELSATLHNNKFINFMLF